MLASALSSIFNINNVLALDGNVYTGFYEFLSPCEVDSCYCFIFKNTDEGLFFVPYECFDVKKRMRFIEYSWLQKKNNG